VVVVVVGYPSLRALSLLTERSRKQLSVVLEFRWWWGGESDPSLRALSLLTERSQKQLSMVMGGRI
jgi:hypothetical protein